tara:strand:+ start:472 stop:801 length:330 start_codon:yes stop_codon:yes gene_type:complete
MHDLTKEQFERAAEKQRFRGPMTDTITRAEHETLLARAVREEREACAEICDGHPIWSDGYIGRYLAEAIRERSKDNKIANGLKDAIAFGKGDETRGEFVPPPCDTEWSE